MNNQKRRQILERLRDDNPHPTTELNFTTPFELLIAGKNAINDWMGRKQRADKAHCSLPAAGARTTQL